MFIRGRDGVLINTDFVVSFYLRPNTGKSTLNSFIVCASDANEGKYDLTEPCSRDDALKTIDRIQEHIESVNQYEVPEVVTRNKPVKMLRL